MVQLSHLHMTTGKTIVLTRWTFVGKIMSLLFNTLSRFATAFLPRSKCLLISWLQSSSAVIREPKKIKPVTASTYSPSICLEVMEQIDEETMETVTGFIFLGSKITADGDRSHEIKRCLLLGREVMTNLDSLLKSRDITLPTKVHLVKAMVFLVVMCGCESWIIKKAECQRISALQIMVLKKTLESPLDYKETKPVNPKRNKS